MGRKISTFSKSVSQIFLKWFLMTSIKNEQKGLFGFLKNDTFFRLKKVRTFYKVYKIFGKFYVMAGIGKEVKVTLFSF